MPPALPRRRVDPVEGRAAFDAWIVNRERTSRRLLALAVRFTLHELAARAPGASTEVRVPPFGVIQCVSGSRHVRGTPPNVVETDPDTWLRLAAGLLGWDDALSLGMLHASGVRAQIAHLLPLTASDSPE
jgi:Bacterial SCP ortholog